MSDTTDDLELWSEIVADMPTEILKKRLTFIAYCKPEDFTSVQHMINAMKKAARNALADVERT